MGVSACAAATLDQLSRGRVLVNIVSGLDNPAAYGDTTVEPDGRYARTQEFLHLLRRLWTEEDVTFRGEHFQVTGSTVAPRPYAGDSRAHPTLYFGGASEAAERVSASEADVQLFWGEPLDGLAERIARLKALSEQVGRRHKPLEFGLRMTTLVRDTTEEAWRAAEEKVATMAAGAGKTNWTGNRRTAVGQQRLFNLARRGEVLDTCLYTTPGTFGGGGAGTTWLVGSADDVAAALNNYRRLGITHFVLSDTPYKQQVSHVGDQLLDRLRELAV
ncbi:LLM class flavin-dependent oxidoreductase [Streptomyces sp. NPDC021212]|uniref:LLM class flavin-dependent oxidoreductase n=1 Tax=Streptomyces sp. NPDC021212 TaxID=3365118 RepID=UPI00378B2E54